MHMGKTSKVGLGGNQKISFAYIYFLDVCDAFKCRRWVRS